MWCFSRLEYSGNFTNDTYGEYKHHDGFKEM